MASWVSSGVERPIDFFLVLDFEATCDDDYKPKPQEIIEFPVLKVNARTLETESEFHTYVQPTAHPVLTAFCTQLTGITQEMVANQPTLPDVMIRFHQWMDMNGLLAPEVKSCFVTCGDWDLLKMLPLQCSYLRIPIPDYFRQWVNIQCVFHPRLVGVNAMHTMLKCLGLTLEGRHHSGIDDCRNTAKILLKLVKYNSNIQPTTKLPPFELK